MGREGDAEGPIVMGVTIESGVSIVNQYPDTAAGASYAPRVPTCRYIRTERTLHRCRTPKYKILGGDTRGGEGGEGGGGLDELERAVYIALYLFPLT